MYILTEQLESAAAGTEAFRLYQEYLLAAAAQFPPNAFALASSQWYHDFSDHRCPHDAWLEELRIRETGTGDRQATRSVEIRIRLLGAYHDGHIEFHYKDVVSYECKFSQPSDGSRAAHADWRCDEFRLSDRGTVLHEIEWSDMDESARWLIDAADVTFTWTPFDISTPAPNER